MTSENKDNSKIFKILIDEYCNPNLESILINLSDNINIPEEHKGKIFEIDDLIGEFNIKPKENMKLKITIEEIE